ncbi:MAG: hypothetical protein NVS4B8_14510 [Herpetosiphon sp.]
MIFHKVYDKLGSMRDQADIIDLLWKTSTPSSTILRLLQQRGPTGVKELERHLGVSTNAVREQLAQLQAADLIQVSKEIHGAGRPLNLYSLSARAQHVLSAGYDTLLNLLIEEILAQDGPAKLKVLLHGISTQLSSKLNVVAGPSDLHHKAQAVLAAFQEHSIPITLVEQNDDVQLQTWSCPYVEVASEHRAVCDMEADMLSDALGYPVHLTHRIVDGATSCCFVVGKEKNLPAGDQIKTNLVKLHQREEHNATRK